MNLKLLKVKDLIKLHQLKLVFEFYEQVIPTDLQNLFTFSRDMHTTNVVLRSARKNFLFIPVIKTSTYRSMKFHCAKLWNDNFKKGIAIDGIEKNNVSLSQLRNKSHLKMTLKNIFSAITLSNNHLLHYKMYIVYQLFYPPSPHFSFPFSLFCICIWLEFYCDASIVLSLYFVFYP